MKRYFMNWVYWLDAGLAVLLGRDFRTTLSWNMAVSWKYGKGCFICVFFCHLFPKHCEAVLNGWTKKDLEAWFSNYDAGIWTPMDGS